PARAFGVLQFAGGPDLLRSTGQLQPAPKPFRLHAQSVLHRAARPEVCAVVLLPATVNAAPGLLPTLTVVRVRGGNAGARKERPGTFRRGGDSAPAWRASLAQRSGTAGRANP